MEYIIFINNKYKFFKLIFMEHKCRFGYTEKTCAEKDFTPCNDNCELPDKHHSNKNRKY